MHIAVCVKSQQLQDGGEHGKAIAKKLLSESKEEKDHIFINYGHNDQVAQMFYKELTKEDKKKVTFIKADLSTYEGMELKFFSTTEKKFTCLVI